MSRHLTVAEVAAISEIAFGGRPPEAREPGLLASAVHRPRARMFGTAAYEDACGGCDVAPTHGRPGLVRALTPPGRR